MLITGEGGVEVLVLLLDEGDGVESESEPQSSVDGG